MLHEEIRARSRGHESFRQGSASVAPRFCLSMKALAAFMLLTFSQLHASAIHVRPTGDDIRDGLTASTV